MSSAKTHRRAFSGPCSCNVGEDNGRVLGQILAGQIVSLRDVALGADEVADASGHAAAKTLLALLTYRVVCRADQLIWVAEQLIRKRLVLGKGRLILYRIEAHAKDNTVRFIELEDSITEPSTFDRSTGSRCLWVPPHGHPLAGKIIERDVGARLVLEVERRGYHTFVKHKSAPSFRCRGSLRPHRLPVNRGAGQSMLLTCNHPHASTGVVHGRSSNCRRIPYAHR